MILECPGQAGSNLGNAFGVERVKRLFTVRKRRRISVVADYAVIFVLEPGFPQGVAELVYGREVKRVDDLRWCGHGVNRIEREPHESRSEEHTSEPQSLMRISYAVFCLKKKNKTQQKTLITIRLMY